ncbi:MAG: translation initiation factor IF-2 [Marvinbryantia sp.]|jgi:translation initiation factor IF-2
MSKMRVHEIARELGRTNKEVINFLTDRGIEIKSHMSMLEDEQVDLVRKNVSSRPVRPTMEKAVQTEKTVEAAEDAHQTGEAPKKKNITRIFRSQNSRTGIQKPAGMKNSENKSAQRPVSQGKPTQQARQTVEKTVAAEKTVTEKGKQEERPAVSVEKKAAPVKSENVQPEVRAAQNGKPAVQTVKSAENRPQNNQNNRGEAGKNNNGGQRTQGGNRTFNRENRDGRDNRGTRNTGDRDNRGQNRNFGDKDGQNRDNRGGQSRSFGDRDNRGGQNRNFGDKDRRDRDSRGGQNRNFGDRDNRGSQSRNQGGRGLSVPQPDMGSKPVTKESRMRNDKDKEKYNNKRDKFERQEKGQGGSNSRGNASKSGKTAGKFIKPVKPVETPAQKKEDEIRNVILPDRMTIRELADILKVQAAAIVKKLFMQGTMVTVNHEIDYDMAEEIALEYNCIAEHEVKVDVIEELLKEEDDAEETLVSRPPVVCVMGHVDHGKTSLLDAIRDTHVTAKESGGITQHIGAYMVSVNGQKITFLDTPGHEAFTAMRMRGANATDIAILVVAADDGVMPQTVEAISHAKAAGTEIIVAINKIDKPSANIDRVKQELSEYELIPEDWGGSTIFVPVSAHTHEGLDNLLEMILLTAEVAELKANPNRKARGLVIEAELDKGKGPVATVLVQKGILHVGDAIAAGACHGKVRAMIDDKGRRVKEAGPSTPVEILGLSDVPNAGEVFVACDNDKEARNFAETFISQNKEKLLEETKARMSLDDLFTQIQAGNIKELNIIVKADVQGSVEAVKQSLLKLSNEEVAVKVIHGGVGAINESDVTLASASSAIIIGFNVRPDVTAKATAERENVDVRLYRVIYDAIADVEAAMKGMLDPVFEEKVIGHAEVRQIFKASGVGTIAGSYVLDGTFQRGCSVRITREGEQIFEGALASLKRFKDDVKEVRAGYECGLVFEKFNDLKEFDQVEAYIMVEVPR